jgi:hypothetical protein
MSTSFNDNDNDNSILDVIALFKAKEPFDCKSIAAFYGIHALIFDEDGSTLSF